MPRWLFKEEPSSYNFAQLQKDGQTTWSGIANAAALKNLRQVKKGDDIFFYHTGKEKAVVGIMQAAADAIDGNEVSVLVKPIRLLDKPVPLSIVKTDEALKDWQLARVPRLSIMPVTAKQWQRVISLSKG